jgi:REP element-mobilizing transposase RayT
MSGMRAGAQFTQSVRRPNSYRVRFRGLPRDLGIDVILERLIACFARHRRNLYDAPDFVLHQILPFGSGLDLLVETTSKQLLLERIGKLKIPFKTVRCRSLHSIENGQRPGLGAWLVEQYGLNSSDPGRRRIRANQRRPIGNNLTYHVWNRTVHRRLLFGAVEKEMIYTTVVRVCRALRVQLHALVVMGNHFHLVVSTQNDVSISELMQKIDGEISRRYNRLHGTNGTLWQGPFRHQVIDPRGGNLLRVIDYVHANPQRAGLVTEASQYEWSSHGHYCGTRRRKGLVVPLSMRRRWPGRKLREAWYREHFASQYAAGKLRSDPAMGKQGIQGTERFVRAILAGLEGPGRLPAFLKGVLKFERQGNVWGLKTLLHLLCRPIVDRWLLANSCWKEMARRIDPLLPVSYVPS